MSFKFLQGICRLGMERGRGKAAPLWSDTPRSYTCSLFMRAELWGQPETALTLTCCFRLRVSSSCRNSAARCEDGQSTWTFMSPKIMMLAGVVLRVERRSCNSGKKGRVVLGRLISENHSQGERGFAWKAQHSNKDREGRGVRVSCRPWRCNTAIPPPFSCASFL